MYIKINLREKEAQVNEYDLKRVKNYVGKSYQQSQKEKLIKLVVPSKVING